MPLRTPDEARAELERQGISISQWASANGFSTQTAFEVLSGRKKGIRGQAHNIAVKLGIKDGEIIEPNQSTIANALGLPVSGAPLATPEDAPHPLPPAPPDERAIACILFPSQAGKWHWCMRLPTLISKPFDTAEQADEALTYLLESFEILGLFKGFPIVRPSPTDAKQQGKG